MAKNAAPAHQRTPAGLRVGGTLPPNLCAMTIYNKIGYVLCVYTVKGHRHPPCPRTHPLPFATTTSPQHTTPHQTTPRHTPLRHQYSNTYIYIYRTLVPVLSIYIPGTLYKRELLKKHTCRQRADAAAPTVGQRTTYTYFWYHCCLLPSAFRLIFSFYFLGFGLLFVLFTHGHVQ